MSFPTSPPANTDPTATNKLASPSHSQLHQSHNAEIVAIEAKVGTGASTPTASKVLRATGTGTSAWAQVDPSTDIATLTSATLRSLLTDETGTGAAVFGTSPSLTTPQVTTSINDSSGNEVIKTPATASATNEITVTNAANGSAPTISATGSSDTNVDLKFIGKGTGKSYPDSITEFGFDFVVSGLVWSGDAYASTLNASMTAGFAYISGVRVTIAAVTARAFTASKDTYIDLSSSGTITYTEVTNNAASPALSANNIRIGIIVSGAGNIAAVGSVNQGQFTKILPIASSIPYQVTDSLGNLICPRDPQRRILCRRQITTNFATSSTSFVQITGLSAPVIIPSGRKVKITMGGRDAFISTAVSIVDMAIFSGASAGTLTTQIGGSEPNFSGNSTTGSAYPAQAFAFDDSQTSIFYNAALKTNNAANAANLEATSVVPAFIVVELC